jgi:hypothetical protein
LPEGSRCPERSLGILGIGLVRRSRARRSSRRAIVSFAESEFHMSGRQDPSLLLPVAEVLALLGDSLAVGARTSSVPAV